MSAKVRQIDALYGFIGLLFGCPLWSLGQVSFDPFDLHPPVKHDIQLSGTFGELRDHHFHTGIDIKSSSGESGDTVFSIADGFVSRIIIESGRYGKGIWIEHPGGYSSQYGHLMRFTPHIDSIVLAGQKEKQAFEIVLNLPADQFVVKKGEVIGLMGNTGHSFGPHLHFEVWRTTSGTSLNPLFFDFSIDDPTSPWIERIDLHMLDQDLTVRNIQSWIRTTKIDTITVNGHQIGLAILGFDPQNGGLNRNGIYSLTILSGDQVQYAVRFDSITSEVAGHYSAYIDYARWIEQKEFLYRCYELPASDRSLNHADRKGLIRLEAGEIKHVKVIARDFFNNTDEISFYLRRSDSGERNRIEGIKPLIRWDSSYSYTTDNYFVKWEEETLFQSAEIQNNLHVDSELSLGQNLVLGAIRIPLRKPIQLGMKPPVEHSDWQCLTMIEKNDREVPKLLGAIWDDGYLVATIPSFGVFAITCDTLPPILQLLERSHSPDILYHSFFLDDNLEHGIVDQNLRYRATVDNEWVLAEFDLKTKQLTCAVDLATLSPGQHVLRLLVTDFVGNRTTYDYQFHTK